MSGSSNASSHPREDAGGRFSTRWLSPRRKRFWAVIALLVYTLGGFFAVPLAVEKLVTGAVRDNLDRTATIDRVRFNPFVLSLEVDGFELADRDGAQLAAFDRLFVNFQLSSLFRWAWTFRTIELDSPMLRFERFAAGDSRLTRLLADLEANAPAADPQPEEPGGLPRLLVHDVAVRQGEVHFRDDVPSESVELILGPVTVSVQELNTLPDRLGRQAVEVRLPDDARLSWQGSISLAPLETEGTLALENSSLHQTIAYLRAVLPVDSMHARLSLRTDYRIEELNDGSLDFELDRMEADLVDLAVTGMAGTPQRRHVRDSLGGSGELARERILGAAVNNALCIACLTGAQRLVFEQHRVVALVTQARQCPQPRNAATHDYCINFKLHDNG